MKHLSLGFLLLAVVAVPLRADDATAKANVKEFAAGVVKATLNKEYDKVVDMTHPAGVAALGGREKAIETTKNFMKEIGAQDFSITSMEAGEPGEIVSGEKTLYAVVPLKTEIDYPKGKLKIKANSYYLGISEDGGATWTFLDGSSLENKNFRQLAIPNLPATVKLPAPQQPEVIPKQ